MSHQNEDSEPPRINLDLLHRLQYALHHCAQEHLRQALARGAVADVRSLSKWTHADRWISDGVRWLVHEDGDVIAFDVSGWTCQLDIADHGGAGDWLIPHDDLLGGLLDPSPGVRAVEVLVPYLSARHDDADADVTMTSWNGESAGVVHAHQRARRVLRLTQDEGRALFAARTLADVLATLDMLAMMEHLRRAQWAQEKERRPSSEGLPDDLAEALRNAGWLTVRKWCTGGVSMQRLHT